MPVKGAKKIDRKVFTLRFLYSAVLYLLIPLVFVRLIWSSVRNPDYWKRWHERFGYCPVLEDRRPVLWIHAVSVGEVHATKPLINQLLKDYPQYQLLITTMTPTGALSVQQNFSDTVKHRYLPYDLPGSVKRFISRIQPMLFVVMETELWPNLFHYCRAKAIPVILANARMSVQSTKGYAHLPQLARKTLSDISLIAAQSKADADRLIQLGAPPDNVTVMGNLKFDIKLPYSLVEQSQSLRRDLSVNRPAWIAASTHEGEEKIILDAFASVLKQHHHCLLIIAPRHPERFNNVVELCEKYGYQTVRKSEEVRCDEHIQVFVLDTLGELPMFYAASDIAFIGGSLVPIGGHNMLEPASLGVPVIIGPYVHNFMEISQLLQDSGAAWTVSDAEQLADKVNQLLADANLRHNAGEKGRQMVETNRGSINRLMQSLQPYLIQNATSERS
ncbi:MAG: lipid IV(A) 3-deoxy-D-manno-octulosonic acid transferase [Gammaproteobacteria bacterium]|nr:lipid IV(A) 3-deoxy-D-manno-octulosonic acid transferase [Gammaproteobacteria bacterium]